MPDDFNEQDAFELIRKLDRQIRQYRTHRVNAIGGRYQTVS